MDKTLLAGALALLALLSLIGMLLYRHAIQTEFSVFKWLTFRFKGNNQPSKESIQESGGNEEGNVQLTASEIVFRDKVTNIYPTPPKTNATLSQSLSERLKFLDNIDENSSTSKLRTSADDLVMFVEKLPHGHYFASKIRKLTRKPMGWAFVSSDEISHRKDEERNQSYRKQLIDASNEIRELINELIQLQQ